MAVPRNRLSNRKKNLKRSHHALKPSSHTTCSQCGAIVMPHRACMGCGTYRGREVKPKE